MHEVVEDEKRTALQKEAVNIWIKSGGNGSILGHPGFGKTRIGGFAAFVVKRAKPTNVTVLVAPNKTICDQWMDEYSTVIDYCYTSNQILCAAPNTIANGKQVSLFIFDEYHKMLGDKTYIAITSLTSKYKLGLFGIEPSGEAKQLIKDSLPIIHVISEMEIVCNNWIKDVEEINIICPLSDSEKVLYTNCCNNIDSLKEGFDELYNRLKGIYPDTFNLIQGCTRGISIVTYERGDRKSKYYSTDDTITNIQKAVGWNPRFVRGNEAQVKFQEYWSAENISIRAACYNKETRTRTNLITKVSTKLDAMELLINSLLPNQVIAYCESIESCNQMYERLAKSIGLLNVGMIHSLIKSKQAVDEDGVLQFFKTGKARMVSADKQKDELIARFKDGDCLILLLVKSLSEGFNVPNLKYVINLSGSRDNVTYGQRKARSNRLDYTGDDSIVFNLVCEEVIEDLPNGMEKIYTNIDSVKLKKRQENRSVRECNLNELNTILEWVTKKK